MRNKLISPTLQYTRKKSAVKQSFHLFVGATLLGRGLMLAALPASAQYKQKNLVANVAGKARFTDPNLVNGWGLAKLGEGEFVVADANTGVATFYRHNGRTPRPAVIIPAAPSSPPNTLGSPTGVAANHTSEFVISKHGKSAPARLLFSTLDGTISGWNPEVDANEAVIIIDNSAKKPFPASYTDLSIARNKYGRTVLYATDSGAALTASNNDVEMYDGNFHLVGQFTDPGAPSDMTVYSARPVDGRIYVTFAGFVLVDGGAVDVFDTEGNLLRRLTTNSPAGPLEAPWAVVRAPSDFGWASHKLLIGGVEDGHINVFNPHTGDFLGFLKDTHGNPIADVGLWGLLFAGEDSNGEDDEDARELFFASGPAFPPNTGEYTDGLFGVITPADREDDSKPPEDSESNHRNPAKSRIAPHDR